MNKQLLEENKKKLSAEAQRLRVMLKRDDVKDSEFPGGFRPKFDEAGTEQTENASEVEQFGNDLAVTEDLTARLQQVEAALSRIEAGTYGQCFIGGEEIEEARLVAEPAAMNCVRHSK